MKNALITGLTGQDGSYLAELLLDKGYKVYGLRRRLSVPNTVNIAHIESEIEWINGDLTDTGSLVNTVIQSKPDEIYNLAAQSFVATSWDQPTLTGNVTALGVVNLLDTIRRIRPEARFYQASSSEMFGKIQESPQRENTPFYPRSPYAVSKVFGHWATVNYRESFGMYTCSGILFNHESPRRGIEFVTRKVSYAAARIKLGLQETIKMGNLEAYRDWGFAKDYVEAMWKMLQQPNPDDYVIATGESHSVRDLVNIAFKYLGLNYENHVVYDPNLTRPAEVDKLVGDASKAKKILQWEPKITFENLIRMMVDADLESLKAHL